jgi:hypothetical protein
MSNYFREVDRDSLLDFYADRVVLPEVWSLH